LDEVINMIEILLFSPLLLFSFIHFKTKIRINNEN